MCLVFPCSPTPKSFTKYITLVILVRVKTPKTSMAPLWTIQPFKTVLEWKPAWDGRLRFQFASSMISKCLWEKKHGVFGERNAVLRPRSYLRVTNGACILNGILTQKHLANKQTYESWQCFSYAMGFTTLTRNNQVEQTLMSRVCDQTDVVCPFRFNDPR